MKYHQLKQGECFTFTSMPAAVYIRCRGGFRCGTGGELLKPLDKTIEVFIYNP